MISKNFKKVLVTWVVSVITVTIWRHRSKTYPNPLAETERKIAIQMINEFYDSMPTHDEAMLHIDDLVDQIVAGNSYLTDRELVKSYVKTMFRLAKN